MSKTITRKYIQRITNREGSTNIRQSSGGGGGGGGVSQYWVDENYVSKEFFNRLFEIHDEEENIIEPNDAETTVGDIQAKAGLWSEQFISALGKGDEEGGDVTLNEPLASINAAGLGRPSTANVGIVWNGLSWTYGSTGGDGTVTSIKVGTISYNPIDGVVTLPAYPTNADTLDGYHANAGNAPFGKIPVITSFGFMDVGDSFEFHYDNSGSLDYSTRLYCTGDYQNSVALPSGSGTLALTTDNVASATKLQTPRTIWGQSFDGTGNVSGAITEATTISASSNVSVGGTLSVTSATTLSSTLGVTGLTTANGGIVIPNGKTLKIGDAELSWDSTNQAVKITKGFYSETFISALGAGSSGSGGVDMATVWTALGNATTEQINATHLSTALSPYATQSWVTQQIASVPSSTTAERLKTARTIWGQSFDGTSNVTGSFWLGNSTGNRFYVRSQTSGESHLHSGFLYDTAGNEAFVFCTGYVSSRMCFYTHTPLDLYDGGDYLTKTPALCIYDGRVSINKMLPDTGYNLDVDGAVRASSFVKLNGTSSQFLKADGSVDSNTYALSSSLSGYLPLSGGTMSNTNLVTNLNSQYLNGYGPYNGTNSGYVFINENNFCEMGTSIEFHYDKTSGLDYSTILRCTGNHGNIVELPSATGTLALTTDNVASATKLQTARTIWGQNFDGTGNVSGAITGATTISASSNVSVGGTLTVTSTSKLTGHVGIGANPHSTYTLRVSGTIYTSEGLYSNGYVTALSDIRHKDIQGEVGLTVAEIANAPAIKFLWKDKRQEGMQVGSIAQYWQKVLPEAVVEGAGGELTMSYGVIALLAAIKTARKVEDLERRVNLLEQENRLLKEQLKVA